MCLQGQEGPGGLRPAVVKAWVCGCNCSGIAGSHLTLCPSASSSAKRDTVVHTQRAIVRTK